MSLKWNENFTFIFLNAYRKHPCLWNPHYVKYYDCLAKNDAFKNIIKELNIPELNISDCLKQIKIIRKKYGQEQIRIIKGFQSGEPYKSPFAWYPIIAEMLTKVIDDESKLQYEMGSTGTLSSLKDYIIYDRYKSISDFPCMQERQGYKTRPRKSSNLDILARKNKRQCDMQLLQCPSCDWEDIKPLDITVPYPENSKLINKPYERHQVTDTMYQEKYKNLIPRPNFLSRLPNYIDYSDIITTHRCPQDNCNYINQQIPAIVAPKPKFCTKETHLLSEQLFPERQTEQIGTSIKQHNKGIQNTVCVPKIKTDIIRKDYKEIQNESLTSQEILKQVAVNTVEQCEKEIQNINCASPNNSANPNCQIYSLTREVKQIDANSVECPANDTQNTIGIKLKAVKGSMPNFILITNDGNYLPLIQRDLKEFITNKCQKDIHNQKEVEKARFTLDNKKLVENEICINETCSSHDIMEIIKHNSAITQALLQLLEKVIQERTKICSVTSVLSNTNCVNSNSSETICEQIPCKFANENTYSSTSSAESESLNCLPCLEKMEKNNTTPMFTKTFLELMKHVLVMSNKNVQGNCVRKEDAINTLIVINKIKECADEILKLYTLVDCSKRQLLNKFYYESKSKRTCTSRKNSIQTQDIKEDVDQFTTSYANSEDTEVLYEPSTLKVRDLLENDITHAETSMEEPFVKDKDVSAHTENHDIGLNISLPQILLRDSETQYTPKQLQDTGIITDSCFEEKISIGTQNREPILIRVIKSNNSEGILKLDKETCVRDAHIPWNVDKCSKNMYQKYSIRKYYDGLLHSGVSSVREKEMNCINYRTSLLDTVLNPLNEIYRYNKRYRNSLSRTHDWTKANISHLESSIQRVSRIPMYARSRKYTRRRTDLYKMSRSYI